MRIHMNKINLKLLGLYTSWNTFGPLDSRVTFHLLSQDLLNSSRWWHRLMHETCTFFISYIVLMYTHYFTVPVEGASSHRLGPLWSSPSGLGPCLNRLQQFLKSSNLGHLD